MAKIFLFIVLITSLKFDCVMCLHCHNGAKVRLLQINTVNQTNCPETGAKCLSASLIYSALGIKGDLCLHIFFNLRFKTWNFDLIVCMAPRVSLQKLTD